MRSLATIQRDLAPVRSEFVDLIDAFRDYFHGDSRRNGVSVNY